MLHIGSSCLVNWTINLFFPKTSVTTMAFKALGRVRSFLQEFIVILPGFSVLVVYSEKYDGSHTFIMTCSCMIHLVRMLCCCRISFPINLNWSFPLICFNWFITFKVSQSEINVFAPNLIIWSDLVRLEVWNQCIRWHGPNQFICPSQLLLKTAWFCMDRCLAYYYLSLVPSNQGQLMVLTSSVLLLFLASSDVTYSVL